jgi:hypothetical protein
MSLYLITGGAAVLAMVQRDDRTFDPKEVPSQNVGVNLCGRPGGQAQDLPLPRMIEKIPKEDVRRM